ncbi:MAG: hypothetical protein ACTHNQ_08480 [Microbacterium sp.]|uniref:hypothetical protein n=1 Tax=Microbacterium sp. TaxID=51671 RepID=UPI003F7F45DC
MIEDLMTEDEARPHLEPHLEAMRKCVEEGWEEWHNTLRLNPAMAVASTTTRANAVYDFIAHRLENYFDSVGVHTSKSRRFLSASIDDGRIEVRVKKFNHPRRLSTSGIPTQQRRAIQYQSITLDGMAVTYVTVGYYPDEIGQGLDVVAVACHYGRTLLWSIDLREDGTVASTPADIRPLDDLDGPSVRSTRRGQQIDEQKEAEGQ